MDILKTVKRSETDPKYRWDLSAIYEKPEDFIKDLEASLKTSEKLREEYRGHLDGEENILEALELLEFVYKKQSRLYNYAALPTEADATDEEAFDFYMDFDQVQRQIHENVSFFVPELLSQEEELLEGLADHDRFGHFIGEVLKDQAQTLSSAEEKVLASLSPVTGAFYDIYNTVKLQDLDFGTFTYEGEEMEMTYNSFEGILSTSNDTGLRRAAYQHFYQKLAEVEEVTARNYLAHCQAEKQIATLRGYDSVFDYLLHQQRVPRELYDRQIDVIMEDLAPVMRRFAKVLQREHDLDRLTAMDLLLAPDPDFAKEVSVEEAQDLVKAGLSVLGEEISGMLDRAFSEQWVDYVNNYGKSTGAFCTSIYEVHPYVLISWTGSMTEAMVLAHELGHAGESFLAGKYNPVFNTNMSMYAVEAPSTANELIMAHYLIEQSQSSREERWLKGQIVARTYFHNFVTHFLEAAFQREVYRLIDAGKSFNARMLNDLYAEQWKKFWGPEIAFEGGVERTWMRQPHYYMGLYPYTYSAGLTIGTQVAQRIVENGEEAAKVWTEALKKSGVLDPIDWAQACGVDIRTDQALKDTIAYIDELVRALED